MPSEPLKSCCLKSIVISFRASVKEYFLKERWFRVFCICKIYFFSLKEWFTLVYLHHYLHLLDPLTQLCGWISMSQGLSL